MTATHDAIVVGGGHNGLVAACYLSRSGLDVLVVEAAPALGGMTASSTLIPTAPEHVINFCAIDMIFIRATDIVADLGLSRYGYREILVDPATTYLHEDGASIAFWQDVSRTVDEINHFSRDDGRAFAELSRTLDAALDVALPFFQTNPRRPAPRALGAIARAGVRHRKQLLPLGSLPMASVAQVVDERFRHPIVRDAIAAQCGVAGPIDTDGSALNLIMLAFYARIGASRLIGGTQVLPDALAQVLQSTGGRTRTGSVVSTVLVSGGRAIGVQLANGEELHARHGVVMTCDPRQALGDLLPAGTLDPVHEARVAHIPANKDGYATFKVDLALSGRVELTRHQKERRDDLDLRVPAGIVGGYQQAIDSMRAARAGRTHPNPCMWTVVPTAVDPSQAPAGQDTLYLSATGVPMCPDEPWSTLASTVGQETVARAGRYFDGIDDLELGRWVESPSEFAQRLRVTNGCVVHADFSPMRLGPFRPAPGFGGYGTPVDGLFLGGSGSHPSPSVTGIPGRLAAEEVLRACRTGPLSRLGRK